MTKNKNSLSNSSELNLSWPELSTIINSRAIALCSTINNLPERHVNTSTEKYCKDLEDAIKQIRLKITKIRES